MIEVEHDLVGPEQFVGPLVEMSASPTGSYRPAPTLGKHSNEVLRESGLSKDEIGKLFASGAIAPISLD